MEDPLNALGGNPLDCMRPNYGFHLQFAFLHKYQTMMSSVMWLLFKSDLSLEQGSLAQQ